MRILKISDAEFILMQEGIEITRGTKDFVKGYHQGYCDSHKESLENPELFEFYMEGKK